MTFEVGNTLGPGAPKNSKSFKAALTRALKAAADGDDAQALEKIATNLVQEALTKGKDWLPAIKEIADRMDGKAQQSVEVTQRTAFDDLSTDELLRLATDIRRALASNPGWSGQSSIMQETRALPSIQKTD